MGYKAQGQAQTRATRTAGPSLMMLLRGNSFNARGARAGALFRVLPPCQQDIGRANLAALADRGSQGTRGASGSGPTPGRCV
jgi:hypothetical protein